MKQKQDCKNRKILIFFFCWTPTQTPSSSETCFISFFDMLHTISIYVHIAMHCYYLIGALRDHSLHFCIFEACKLLCLSLVVKASLRQILSLLESMTDDADTYSDMMDSSLSHTHSHSHTHTHNSSFKYIHFTCSDRLDLSYTTFH